MKSKINILKTRPKVTDEEIYGYSNFDSVLHQFHVKSLWNWQHGFYGAIGAITLAVIYVILPDSISTIPKTPTSNSVVVSSDSTHFTENPQSYSPLIVPSSVSESKESNHDPQVSKPSQEMKQPEEDNTNTDYQYLQAEPVEGYSHLYSYFETELHYPTDAVSDSIQGTLLVSFEINREGMPGKITIQNSMGPLFDKETLRLIEHMPAWRAATMNGKPVSSRITIPLTFRIVQPIPVKKE